MLKFLQLFYLQIKSKLLSLFFLIAANLFLFNTGKTQNLISNPSFEDSTGQPSLTGWIINDTVYSSFSQDTPVGGGNWSLQLLAGWIGGLAETYITGQSGTNVYKLNVWLKTDSLGPGAIAYISLGTLYQNQFTPKKEVFYDNTPNWTQYSLTDTLTTQSDDTIVVRLYAGYVQIISPASYFDLVELKKNDFDTTLISEEKYADANFNIRVYPNPTTGKFNLEINALQKFNAEIEEVLLLNINEQIIFTEKLNTTVNNFSKEIDLKDYAKGIYILRIITTNDVINKKLIVE